HVRAELGDHLETIVALGAREALAGRRAHDPALLAQANYPELEHALEERFFSRARAIKREACRTRLAALLESARALGSAPLGGGRPRGSGARSRRCARSTPGSRSPRCACCSTSRSTAAIVRSPAAT